MDELLAHKLNDISEDVADIKKDVRQIKDEAPIHRISSLEAWKASVNKFMAMCGVAIIGAWAAVLLAR